MHWKGLCVNEFELEYHESGAKEIEDTSEEKGSNMNGYMSQTSFI